VPTFITTHPTACQVCQVDSDSKIIRSLNLQRILERITEVSPGFVRGLEFFTNINTQRSILCGPEPACVLSLARIAALGNVTRCVPPPSTSFPLQPCFDSSSQDLATLVSRCEPCSSSSHPLAGPAMGVWCSRRVFQVDERRYAVLSSFVRLSNVGSE
jgi:hypothetical protein